MHTPGPLYIKVNHDEGNERTHNAWISASDDWSPGAGKAWLHPNYVGSCVGEDNARLIAAAPDLLEALKRMTGYAHSYKDRFPASTPVSLADLNWAEDVIAKAEGH